MIILQLCEILLYFGLLVMSISLVAASIWFIAIIFLYLLSRYEEKLLLARFGSEYERYMKEIPMFLPWIRVNRNKKTG
ncbi:MAG: hypothetical protein PHG48_05520 [Eubacteriales bacterium]|nr:hypothetical protein [Eubacteriales bacterium]